MSINIRKFECDQCDYKCCKQSEWTKHITTRKHVARTSLEPSKPHKYVCKLCDREYLARNSLWYHQKKCVAVKDSIDGNEEKEEEDKDKDAKDIKNLTNIIVELVKSNNDLQRQSQDFQKQLMELCKNGTNINNTTNNNQKFNINVFLNEQCKDAINFADFVKNIEVSREDIQNTGQLGFVNGISKIIMDNLKQLGVNERPIHCTDLKRETMYIKDEDTWNKEEDDTKLRNAIQTVSRKSVKTLQDWKQVNPDYENGDSEFSQECLSMQRHSVAGEDREVYYPKVARLVAKEVIIDKI